MLSTITNNSYQEYPTAALTRLKDRVTAKLSRPFCLLHFDPIFFCRRVFWWMQILLRPRGNYSPSKCKLLSHIDPVIFDIVKISFQFQKHSERPGYTWKQYNWMLYQYFNLYMPVRIGIRSLWRNDDCYFNFSNNYFNLWLLLLFNYDT